jgi:hypothetical protein
LPPAFTMVSFSASSSTLRMGAICYSETSVDFQRTTLRYIQKAVLFITTAVRTKDPKHNHCSIMRNMAYRESIVI